MKTELLRAEYLSVLSKLDTQQKTLIEEYVNSLRLLNSILISESGTSKSKKIRRSMWHDGKTRWFIDDMLVARETCAVNDSFYCYEIYDCFNEPKKLTTRASTYDIFCKIVEKEIEQIKF